jgi:hypothetical protein
MVVEPTVASLASRSGTINEKRPREKAFVTWQDQCTKPFRAGETGPWALRPRRLRVRCTRRDADRLVSTIITGSTDSRAPQAFAALARGLTLTLFHRICIPLTKTRVNPARSTGPAIFAAGRLGVRAVVEVLVGAAARRRHLPQVVCRWFAEMAILPMSFPRLEKSTRPRLKRPRRQSTGSGYFDDFEFAAGFRPKICSCLIARDVDFPVRHRWYLIQVSAVVRPGGRDDHPWNHKRSPINLIIHGTFGQQSKRRGAHGARCQHGLRAFPARAVVVVAIGVNCGLCRGAGSRKKYGS